MEQKYSHEQIDAINLCKLILSYKESVINDINKEKSETVINYYQGILQGVTMCIDLTLYKFDLNEKDIQ